jgi:hypothetical protein
MAETKDRASEPLQTVEDALDAQGAEALKRWAEQSATPPVQEAPKQEAPAEPEQPVEEETTDLSQPTPEETTEDDSVEDEPGPITHERVQKRINQLTAKAKSESERAAAVQAELEQTKARQAELEAKLQELENAPPQQQAKPPVVPETQKLLDAENEQAQLGKTARDLLWKMEDSPDETLELLRQKVGINFPSVVAAKRWLDEAREHAAEKRQEFKRQRELAEDGVRRQIESKVGEARKQAEKTYPWLTKPDKDQQAIISRLRKEFNGIDNAPLVLARLVAAELAERKPATAPIIPPRVPAQTKVPVTTRTNGSAPDKSKLRSRLLESEGKEEDLANYFK